MTIDPATGLVAPDSTGAAPPSGASTAASATPTADAVNGLLSQNSPYMQQAKSAGMDVANQRGLLNSSIAAGTSQKAAYDAAVPIATNDANIAATAANIGTQTKSAQDIAAAGNLSAQQISTANIAANQKLAQLSATTQTNIASMNIDAAAKQQAAAILSQEQMATQQTTNQAQIAQLQANTQQSIAAMNISDADKQQLLSLAAQQSIATQTQSTQLQVANMNVTSDQQDKAQAAAVSYANIYSTSVNAINANKDIPEPARSQALQDALTLYNNSMGLVEQTYNVQLNWGQPTATPPTAAAATTPTATPTAAATPATIAANSGYSGLLRGGYRFGNVGAGIR